jgi:serine/threonine protein kinase/N-acetylneuraminic acid mutarotase
VNETVGDELVGRVIGPGGKYRLLSVIGRGGMATVFQAEQLNVPRQVAIKVADPVMARQPTFVQRFRQEIVAVARLEHGPHILPVYDVGDDDGLLYMVMPLVTGGTLKDRLERDAGRPWPPRQTLILAQQVLEALDYAHRLGFIHRDVKPSNILLEGDRVYLADFGIAKVRQESAELSLASGTLTGAALLGTPAYMAPEQALGLPLDRRADVYAFGVVLYQLFTGRVPYEATTPMQLAFKHVEAALPRPSELNPGLHPSIEAVLLQALARQPEGRFPTAAAFGDALAAAVDEAEPVVRRSPVPAPPAPPAPSERAGAAAAGAALAAGVAPGVDQGATPVPSDSASQTEIRLRIFEDELFRRLEQVKAQQRNRAAPTPPPTPVVPPPPPPPTPGLGQSPGLGALAAGPGPALPPAVPVTPTWSESAEHPPADVNRVVAGAAAGAAAGGAVAQELQRLNAAALQKEQEAAERRRERDRARAFAPTPLAVPAPPEDRGQAAVGTPGWQPPQPEPARPPEGPPSTPDTASAGRDAGRDAGSAAPAAGASGPPPEGPEREPEGRTGTRGRRVPLLPTVERRSLVGAGIVGLVALVSVPVVRTIFPSGWRPVVGPTVPTPSPPPYPSVGPNVPPRPLAQTRFGHTATLLQNGQLLVVGGLTADSTYLASAELYDPATNQWTTLQPMARARANHTATLLQNGQVLVAAGQDGDDSFLGAAELFDPQSKRWTSVDPMGSKRADHTATLLQNGKVLVVGGHNEAQYFATGELYDPAAKRWSPGGRMLSGVRKDHSAVLLANGRVLVVGGTDATSALASVELYDPAANAWSGAAGLATGRIAPTLSALPGGQILAVGGETFARIYNSIGVAAVEQVERYDPGADRWAGAAPLAQARVLHTATSLVDGRVLVTGGTDHYNAFYGAAELYDPAADRWAAVGSLNRARAGHTATLLKDGQVLVAGGRDATGYLSNVDRYDPSTGHWLASG